MTETAIQEKKKAIETLPFFLFTQIQFFQN
jgi:hypothetical protein